MSITSGFFNGVDRQYDAEQMSSIFDGIVRDGVFESYGSKFRVRSSAANDNRVIVGSGRAWFDHTWTLNDADLSLTLSPSEAVLKRIDAIVLDVDRNVGVRANTIKVIKGVPATNPTIPARIKSEENNQYMLAHIMRHPNKGITTDDITITVGSNECPWVTAPIQSISVEPLFTQLRAEWTAWYNGFQSKAHHQWSALQDIINTEWSQQSSQINQDAIAQRIEIKDEFVDFMRDSYESFQSFMTESNTAFSVFITTSESTFSSKITSWTTAYNTFMSGLTADAEAIFDDLTEQVEGMLLDTSAKLTQANADIAEVVLNGNLSIDKLKSDIATMAASAQSSIDASNAAVDALISAKQMQFDSWFAGLESALDGNVAAKLTADVLALQTDKADITYVNELVGDINLALEGVMSGE